MSYQYDPNQQQPPQGYPPQQPGYTPQQPMYPQQPPQGYPPQQPGYGPPPSGYPPQQPAYPPSPGYGQPQAGYAPPGYAPPGYAPPGYAPPGYAPQQPGYPPQQFAAPQAGYPAATRTQPKAKNRFAVTALIYGAIALVVNIVGLFFNFYLTGILAVYAIYVGIRALIVAARTQGNPGIWMAIGGLVMAVLSILITILGYASNFIK